mmetsp:Transcript_24742/g.74340  ORF Transcript_24742/g.74340 Transcript_24742/m.74340 type:complete len:274 (-) Transcript_24742:277-1098(-)
MGLVSSRAFLGVNKCNIRAHCGSLHPSALQVVGLWSGNTINCLRIFPNKALLYMFQDSYKDFFKANLGQGQFPILANFLGGGLAGMSANVITYPLDTIRARQAGLVKSKSVVQIVGDTLKLEGVGGFYRGLTPSMIGAIPYEGLKFGCYAFFRDLRPAAVENNTIWTLISGAGAGMICSTVMYPNDTVRRILQLQGMSDVKEGKLGPSKTPKKPYTGMVQVYRETYRKYGIKRFYSGLRVNLVRIVPNTAIQFAIYDYGKSLISKYEAKALIT